MGYGPVHRISLAPCALPIHLLRLDVDHAASSALPTFDVTPRSGEPHALAIGHGIRANRL